MSNSDSVTYQIPLPTSRLYHILNVNRSNGGYKITVMIAIDENEEKSIDDIGSTILMFKRGDRIFKVAMNDIYCYGEVDFLDIDTLNQIDSFKFLDYLGAAGVHVQSQYDYQTHSCSSPKRYCLWSETWSPALLAQMAHGYIGKPKRILLFNQNAKKW